MRNPTRNGRLYLGETDVNERKPLYKALAAMTEQEHESEVLRIRNEKDHIARIAKNSGFDRFKEQVRFCATEARAMQRDWWVKYGDIARHGFGSRREVEACAKRIRRLDLELGTEKIKNRILIEALRSEDGKMWGIDQDLGALGRIAALLERSAARQLRMVKARYDLRLMSFAPRALWAMKHGRRIDFFEPILRGSDNPETVFVYNVLWHVDPTVTVETVKNIDQGLDACGEFLFVDWQNVYMPRFETIRAAFSQNS